MPEKNILQLNLNERQAAALLYFLTLGKTLNDVPAVAKDMTVSQLYHIHEPQILTAFLIYAKSTFVGDPEALTVRDIHNDIVNNFAQIVLWLKVIQEGRESNSES